MSILGEECVIAGPAAAWTITVGVLVEGERPPATIHQRPTDAAWDHVAHVTC